MGGKRNQGMPKQKKSDNKEKTLQVLVFVTAILNLIQALVKLIAEALK